MLVQSIMPTVSSTEIKNDPAGFFSQLQDAGPTVILNKSKVQAVVVSPEFWDELSTKIERLQAKSQLMDRWTEISHLHKLDMELHGPYEDRPVVTAEDVSQRGMQSGEFITSEEARKVLEHKFGELYARR